MVENITIVDKNGNGIIANGVMHIFIKDIGKKFICYTLNEMATPDDIKVYVAETADTVGVAAPIDEESWKSIKKLMVSITHKEDTPNVEFIKMNGATFYTGDTRKLQIKLPVKQALVDAQMSNVLAVNSVNSVGENKVVFFDQSVVEEPVVTETSMAPAVNAFSMSAEQQEEPAPLTNVVNSVVEEPAIPIPVEEPVISDTIVPVAENKTEVINTVLQPEPVLEPPVDQTSTNVTISTNSNKLVTNQEAIDSINFINDVMPKVQDSIKLLNDYIKQHEQSLEGVKQTVVEQPKIPEQQLTTPQSEPLDLTTNTVIEVQPPQIVIEPLAEKQEEPVQFINTSSNSNEMIEQPVISVLEQTTEPAGIIDPTMIVQTSNVLEVPSNSAVESPVSVETQQPEIMQPVSMPVLEYDIPDVTPVQNTQIEPQDYTYVAQGNNSAAIINSDNIQMQEMPAVVMPTNYENIEEAKNKMMGQSTLGPSGLSEDSQKTLSLAA